jgi:hypothetical protein
MLEGNMDGEGRIQQGMRVVCVDGGEIGVVKGLVGQEYFEVEQQGAPTWFVPFAAIASVEDEIVRLNITQEQAKHIQWI